MAGDLRSLSAMLQVALELEHIGNHTKEIAEINLKIDQIDLPDTLSDVAYMAKLASKMLDLALKAFAHSDAQSAQCIPLRDDAVDNLYARVHRKSIKAITTDRRMVSQAIYLSQIGHQLERIADRVTNICEWVVFAVTGEMTELNGMADADRQPANSEQLGFTKGSISS